MAKYRLQDGSIIAIAYALKDTNSYRVAWVYPDESLQKNTPQRKPSSYYKERTESKQPAWTENELQLIKGKQVVVIGADFRASDFSSAAQEADLDLIFLKGTEYTARIKATCYGKDLIISASQHGSHRSSDMAKKYAKGFEIPFRASPTSLTSIKKAIVHGIEFPEIPFVSFF